MRSIDNAFYHSKTWARCRKAYAKSVGGLCENCKARGILKAGEIVHHKIPLTPERMGNEALMYGFENLELLCFECHNRIHKSKGRYVFDAEGNIISTE